MTRLHYKSKIISGLFSLLLLSGIFACKKTDDAPFTPPPTPMGLISLHMHSNIDTSEVTLGPSGSGIPVNDASGRKIQLDVAQFYISGVTLKKTDGSSYSVPKVYILKEIGVENYVIGKVPAGNYTSLSFNIGIDAATNGTLPASYPPSNVLSPQKPNAMWFNSTQGFIFMNIQGLVDTSAKNNGPINIPISYQIGGNDLLTTVHLPAKPFSVTANGNETIHLVADYSKLLNGVNFKKQSKATPWSNSAVVIQMASNIPLMFKYEY